jgi:hypothetical protein
MCREQAALRWQLVPEELLARMNIQRACTRSYTTNASTWQEVSSRSGNLLLWHAVTAQVGA